MFKTVLRKLIPNQLLTIALSFFLFSFSIRSVLLIQELVKKGTEFKLIPLIYLQGFYTTAIFLSILRPCTSYFHSSLENFIAIV